MRRSALFLGCALLAGCGGGEHHNTASKTSTVAVTTVNPAAQLEQAARLALQENAKVSDYVLEHNAIPSWASRSTAGPALDGMRSSANQRKGGHITVRVVSSAVQIHSVALDPSYAEATANVTERSRVVPYRNGHPLGRPMELIEPARVQLHRVGSGTTFVVWKLAPAR